MVRAYKSGDCDKIVAGSNPTEATFYERNYLLHEKLPFTREVTFYKRNYENFQFIYNYRPGEIAALSLLI